MPENTVKVDRSTKWGNPFVTGKHGTREECVRKFERLMQGHITVSCENAHEQVKYLNVAKEHIHELKGKNLACWCPDDICHATVLIWAANKEVADAT